MINARCCKLYVGYIAIATFEWKSSLGLMVCIKISKYLHIKDLFPTPQPIFDAVPRPLPQSIKAVIKSIVLLYDMDSMEVDK